MLQMRLNYALADRRPAAAVLAFALSHCDPSSGGRHSVDMVNTASLDSQPGVTCTVMNEQSVRL